MLITSTGKTDKGHVRDNNEDNFTIDEKNKFFIVADGAGGHLSGEVASKTAVDIAKQQLAKFCKGENIAFGQPAAGLSEKASALLYAMRFANQIVFEASKNYPQNNGMATTCVGVFVDEASFAFSNVGDSRIYLFRNKELKQITTDHSLVQEQVKLGLMTEEQAEKSEYRNVLTRAIGIGQDVAIDVAEMKAEDGDLLILCSDGLTKMVPDSQIKTVIGKNLELGATISDLSDVLVAMALEAGGRDNVTIVLVQLFKDNMLKKIGRKIFR